MTVFVTFAFGFVGVAFVVAFVVPFLVGGVVTGGTGAVAVGRTVVAPVGAAVTVTVRTGSVTLSGMEPAVDGWVPNSELSVLLSGDTTAALEAAGIGWASLPATLPRSPQFGVTKMATTSTSAVRAAMPSTA